MNADPAFPAAGDRCNICGAPRVESGDGHDDATEPLCLRHLKALDPDAADLPEMVLTRTTGSQRNL